MAWLAHLRARLRKTPGIYKARRPVLYLYTMCIIAAGWLPLMSVPSAVAFSLLVFRHVWWLSLVGSKHMQHIGTSTWHLIVDGYCAVTAAVATIAWTVGHDGGVKEHVALMANALLPYPVYTLDLDRVTIVGTLAMLGCRLVQLWYMWVWVHRMVTKGSIRRQQLRRSNVKRGHATKYPREEEPFPVPLYTLKQSTDDYTWSYDK